MVLMPLENLVWYLNIVAAAALAIHLFREGLASVYYVLVMFLIADTVQQVLRLILIHNANASGWIYAVGQAIKATLSVFIVLNLYWLALSGRPALARFSRTVIGYCFAIAAAISAVGILLDIRQAHGRDQRLRAFLTFERSMDSVVLIVLMLVTCLLVWFPLQVRRNVALYIGGFAVYWFGRWAGLLATNLFPTLRGPMSIAMLSLSFACMLGWLLTLRRAGETVTTVTGHRWNTAEADRLKGQLDAINARLESLSRN